MIAVNVSDLVRQIEEESSESMQELGTAIATMLVNYGRKGRLYRGLVSEQDSLVQMIIKVCTFYEERCKGVTGDGEKNDEG